MGLIAPLRNMQITEKLFAITSNKINLCNAIAMAVIKAH